ncbi:sigma 54-interacting transcriptional regulator [Desulfobacterales bacterium RS19-109]|uniref:Sigma 54-interacting transcriptional regulator n=2 Tax=Thiovibrio frasassiensis TaxID=2984131 RepID=A0A9X4MG95_9BACT|nr:sigma 54-interacting transcriptional regulator [Thiovibrio frasassiensis]
MTERRGLHTALTEAVLESISDGVFTVDEHWRIISFNRAAEEITGMRRKEAIGEFCWDVFRSNMCKNDCALRQTMKTGSPIINRSASIINHMGDQVPISISTSLLRNSDGRIIGGAESFRDLSMMENLRRELEGRIQIADLITRSPAMQKIVDMLPQIAASNSTVLIEGETGTGKELLARAIHDLSPRADKPLVSINCGALPDSLLESELFGYKAGAFTGANKDKVGRFALAEGGTFFLDEIGEISQALQVRFLRVLQEKVYEPLGGTQSVKTDVRVIAATNRSLAHLVTTGEFRQDLFYRINVVKITLPPLRERKEDIPLLVHHFISRFNRRQKKSIQGLNMEALALLLGHEFLGNIRELENIIEHAFVLRETGMITPDDFPAEILFMDQDNLAVPGTAAYQNTQERPAHPNEFSGMESAVHAVEAKAIIDALKRNNFNRVAAARELGIHKSTLFRKIRALGISLPQVDGRFRPYGMADNPLGA